MTSQITVTVPLSAEGVEELRNLVSRLSGEGALRQTFVPVSSTPVAVHKPVPAVTAEEDKPKRHRRTKAEIEAEKAALKSAPSKPSELPSAGATDSQPDPLADIETSEIDVSEMRKAPVVYTLEKDIIPGFQGLVAKLGSEQGRAKAQDIVKKYGVHSIRAISQDRYPEVMQDLSI